MNWIYKNNTGATVIFRNNICKPNCELETNYPVPSSLGLTCIQEGSSPDPVLFHDDIIINAGEQKDISLDTPINNHNVALSILCMANDGGVECRFNHSENKPVPIDVRGFRHVLPWEFCSRIFLLNPTSNSVHISVSAIEVVN